MTKLSPFLLIFLVQLNTYGFKATSPQKAYKIWEQLGTKKYEEELVWHPPSTAETKTWKRLSNKYFNFRYPKCMRLHDFDSETGVNESAAVRIEEDPSCPRIRDTENTSILTARYRPEKKDLLETSFNGWPIYRQPLRIQGQQLMITIGVSDTCAEKLCYSLEVWISIATLCGKNPIFITHKLPTGKVSEDFVKQGPPYTLPQEFRDIASTFECGDGKNLKYKEK